MTNDTIKLARTVLTLMAGGGEARVLAKMYGKAITVSTVVTSDMGPETAILDLQGAHPVERYPTEEAALLGHAIWVAKELKPGDTIHKLGYGDVVDGRDVVLKGGN